MQNIFNSRMERIQSHDEYPKYARSETKPVVRARNIIDQGLISDKPCTVCMELGQDCYRWEGTFSKCAYCTSKDKKRELCHVPQQEVLPAPEKRKRRKMSVSYLLNAQTAPSANTEYRTGNIYAPGGDAASTADTMMSGTLVSGALASGMTPFSGVPMSGTGSVRGRAPSPDPASDMMDTRIDQPPTATEAGSEATLERVTALENQVSCLETKVVELLVKLEEVSSCVSTGSTPGRQAAAGASPTASDITFEELQARRLSDAPPPVNVAAATDLATREWVEGPKTPELPDVPSPVQVTLGERVEEPMVSPLPEHTIEHPEGYKPVNCDCSGP